MADNIHIKSTDALPRGADLTEADLRLIVDDFVTVRNWAALAMHMSVPDMKEQLYQALRVRPGRRPIVTGERGDHA